MAIFRWLGGDEEGTTAWNLPANWQDENGVQYTVDYPCKDSDFDEAWFDTDVTYGPAGYDVEGDANHALQALKVGPEYDLTLGTSEANPLILEVSKIIDGVEVAEVLISADAAGDIFLKGAGGTDGLAAVRIIGGNDDGEVHLGGVMDRVSLLKANCVLTDDSAIGTRMDVSYLSSRGSDVALTIDDGHTFAPAVYVDGGRITSDATDTLDALVINHGTWNHDGDADITALRLGGGTLNWAAGDIADAQILGGQLDASGSQVKRSVVGTIYDGSLVLANGLRNIAYQITRFGGSIEFDPGETFSRLVP